MTLAVLVSALVAAPGTATAARGLFVYYEPSGGAGIIDPDDNTCYRLEPGTYHLDNQTNRQALLYAAPDCGGAPSAVMAPNTELGAPGHAAVLFHR
ncbi:hypothetical protein V5P93_005167 [Actinokineospora auranticolor]|uniref:Peptidase inhibitor family I36 n=1 Tax=Actinokineospora auranticolor TaxID=155976 RepID=A0A2S6GKF1_9PSEU|nr:hypothetical protein [Actinokineospora auranticolor]PPK65698.1 hypothetical protein CLV40_113182 [Actinokineospora auranticolor]